MLLVLSLWPFDHASLSRRSRGGDALTYLLTYLLLAVSHLVFDHAPRSRRSGGGENVRGGRGGDGKGEGRGEEGERGGKGGGREKRDRHWPFRGAVHNASFLSPPLVFVIFIPRKMTGVMTTSLVGLR